MKKQPNHIKLSQKSSPIIVRTYFISQSSIAVVIPKKIREKLKIQPGALLLVQAMGNGILYTPLTVEEKPPGSGFLEVVEK